MAAFRHGVYTSEVQTALQAAPAVDSALPFVVGAAKQSFPPTVISTWRQFVEVSGITEGTDDVAGDDGWHELSLVSFAYLWFRLCGRGDCVMRGIASADGSLSQGDVVAAINELDTVYERVRRLPSLVVVPYFGGNSAIWTAMKSKAEQYGGRFKAIAIGDIQCNEHALSGVTPTIISSPSDVAAAKTVSDTSLVLCWPYIGIGDLRFDLSSALVAVANRVDGQNGDLPFVSPSNKNCYATGVYVMPADEKSISVEGCYTDPDLYVVDGKEQIEATYAGQGGTRFAVQFTLTQSGWTTYSGQLTCHAVVNSSMGGDYENTALVDFVDGVGSLDIADGSSVYSPTITVAEVWDLGNHVTSGIDIPGVSATLGSVECVADAGKWKAASAVSEASDFVASYSEYNESPLYQSRDEVNSALGANGIVGALNTADGWVAWGNDTTAFPGSTDVKDYIIAERRMFNYTQNLFQLFAQPRIDNPLNRRQLEGVVNSFNQILASLQGFGALNSAAVELDDERNTTEQLIRGVVYFRIRIAPPPPMQEINGVFEFDVQGFEASLA